MNKIAVVFSMKSCPHCQDFKKLLDDAEIDYLDRDIYEHEEADESMQEMKSWAEEKFGRDITKEQYD